MLFASQCRSGTLPASVAFLCLAASMLASPAFGSDAVRVLETWGIRVEPEPGAAVPDDVAEGLVAGVLALPDGLRRSPGGPLVFELRSMPAPFGMGDGSPQRPDWRAGRERFVLYAYEEPDEPRAHYR